MTVLSDSTDMDIASNTPNSDVDPECDAGDPYALPLFEGANLSIFESYFLVFQFSIRHSLSSTAFTELLDLIRVHVPSSAKVAKSIL